MSKPQPNRKSAKRPRRSSKSLIGKKYGKLTILGESNYARTLRRMVKCVCECGKEKDIELANLVGGRIKSCGCLRKGFQKGHTPLRGDKFGRLTIVDERDKVGSPPQRAFNVICDCGTEKWVRLYQLTSGGVKSCGCLRQDYYDSIRKYDLTPVPEHTSAEDTEDE